VHTRLEVKQHRVKASSPLLQSGRAVGGSVSRRGSRRETSAAARLRKQKKERVNPKQKKG